MPLSVTPVPFEAAAAAKSISMSTFVLFSEGLAVPMGSATRVSVTSSQDDVRFKRASAHLNGAS